MKIEQNTPGFSPVTITLETVEEVALVASALGAVVASDLRQEVRDTYGIDTPALTYPLFTRLDDIVKENKCLLRG